MNYQNLCYLSTIKDHQMNSFIIFRIISIPSNNEIVNNPTSAPDHRLLPALGRQYPLQFVSRRGPRVPEVDPAEADHRPAEPHRD